MRQFSNSIEAIQEFEKLILEEKNNSKSEINSVKYYMGIGTVVLLVLIFWRSTNQKKKPNNKKEE
jgi:hypothetical protein